MLGFSSDRKNSAKCHVTHGVICHINPEHPPSKRKPFSAILNHNFIQRVELILPEDLFIKIEKTILSEEYIPEYSRVILPLKALLEKDFFNEYIKKGNILMLSEGRIGADNVYLLKDGKLRLHLDRKSYEMAGLVGKPDGVKGNRGVKARWVVEIDLRQPSMQYGKKGFDRIIYAFENVLKIPVTWLFCNLESKTITPDPLDKNFPVRKLVNPKDTREMTVLMPSLKPPLQTDPEFDTNFEYYLLEIHEWFSLVMLDSPRVQQDDKIDSILSRYCPPENTTVTKLVKILWRGFISPSWAHRLFIKILSLVYQNSWFMINVSGFPRAILGECNDCMILKLPNLPGEYILWEIS